jgi:hypothetical protein
VERFESALENIVGTAERVRRHLALTEAAGSTDPAEQRPAHQLTEHFLRA